MIDSLSKILKSYAARRSKLVLSESFRSVSSLRAEAKSVDERFQHEMDIPTILSALTNHAILIIIMFDLGQFANAPKLEGNAADGKEQGDTCGALIG